MTNKRIIGKLTDKKIIENEKRRRRRVFWDVIFWFYIFWWTVRNLYELFFVLNWV